MNARRLKRRYYVYSLTETHGLIAPVWVLLLLQRGLSFTEIGALGALYWAVLVLAEIPTGYLGDRVGRRRSLIAAALLSAAGVAGLAFARSVLPFALALTAWAVGVTFRSGTADAWLYSVLDDVAAASYTRLRGRGRAVKLAATAITAVIGSVLYTQLLLAPFVLSAGLLIVNAVVVLSFPPTSRSALEVSVARSSQYAVTWREVRRVFKQPGVRSFVLYTVLLFGLVEVARTFVQPVVVGNEVGLSVVALGVLYASFYVASAGASAATADIENAAGVRAWFIAAPALLAGSFLILPIFPVLAVASFIGMEAVWQVSETFQTKVINDHTGDYRRATVLSVVSMLGGVAAIAFRVVGGVLADLLGPLVMLAVTAGVFLLAGGALLAVSKGLLLESNRFGSM